MVIGFAELALGVVTTDCDVLIGAAGVDTVTTNTGTDIVLTSSGDDVITVNGAGNKTLDGGAGTDSIAINLSGHTSLSDFSIAYASGAFTFTDKSSNVISLKNMETYTIGGVTYEDYIGGLYVDGASQGISNVFWGQSTSTIHGFGGAILYLGGGLTNFSGLSSSHSGNINYNGSGHQDTLNLNNDRTQFTGNLTIALGDGSDNINSAKFKNSDSLDAGAGDDTVSVMVGGGYGTPSLATFSMVKLDGGSGSDTLSFEESTTGGAELTLSLGGAINFENLNGSSVSETLRGSTGDNILTGNSGADTLYGGGGNDTLKADGLYSGPGDSNQAGYFTDNDNLYGEAGNDTLTGNAGDNTLDGGTGADTITTGSGSDTIVLRVGDGGSTLAAADTIADFTDGTDVLGMDNGMQYTDLTIAQGAGSNSNDTIIKAGTEYLMILTGIDVGLISEADLTPVDII